MKLKTGILTEIRGRMTDLAVDFTSFDAPIGLWFEHRETADPVLVNFTGYNLLGHALPEGGAEKLGTPYSICGFGTVCLDPWYFESINLQTLLSQEDSEAFQRMLGIALSANFRLHEAKGIVRELCLIDVETKCSVIENGKIAIHFMSAVPVSKKLYFEYLEVRRNEIKGALELIAKVDPEIAAGTTSTLDTVGTDIDLVQLRVPAKNKNLH